ncbi:MAG: thermonuclease family protein [Candidatus Omnitrophota bacterium]|nr:thermonuclease family protein [Candidatus Omnitrophota bacterium]
MKTKKELKVIRIIAIAVAVIVIAGARVMNVTGRSVAAKSDGVVVSRVIDGDTIKLSDGRRVRLLGIDSPELHYSEKLVRDSHRTHKDMKEIQAMGQRAAGFTKRLCEGKPVRIESDIRKLDKYGRLLAYIYLPDGTFVNAKVLEEGYAQVMTIPPNVKYAEYFLKLQREAKENRKGLWALAGEM